MTLSTHFTARTISAAVLIAALSGVASCSQNEAPDDVPHPSATAAPTPSAGSTPSAAQKKAATARKALNALAAKKPSPTTTQLFSALTAAGFERSRLEATHTKTPLENDTPSIMYGIKIDKSSCLVGEIREGVATVTIADAVEKNTRCLIGVVDRPGN